MVPPATPQNVPRPLTSGSVPAVGEAGGAAGTGSVAGAPSSSLSALMVFRDARRSPYIHCPPASDPVPPLDSSHRPYISSNLAPPLLRPWPQASISHLPSQKNLRQKQEAGSWPELQEYIFQSSSPFTGRKIFPRHLPPLAAKYLGEMSFHSLQREAKEKRVD